MFQNSRAKSPSGSQCQVLKLVKELASRCPRQYNVFYRSLTSKLEHIPLISVQISAKPITYHAFAAVCAKMRNDHVDASDDNLSLR